MTGGSGLRVTFIMARRELVRFVRQPARIAAAVGTPLIIWLFMASGFTRALQPEQLNDLSYGAFLLPGMMTLVAVFASIFTGFTVIEDRNEGWLRAVLVAPVPRWSIALGRTIGGAMIAWAQAAPLMVAIVFMQARVTASGALLALAALAVTSIAVTAMSVALSWRCETSGAFHALMNLVFIPLWLLSGAFFPADGAATWLAWLMRINPVTWCTSAIREAMAGDGAGASLALAAVFAVAMIIAATAVVARPNRRLR